MHLHLLIKPKQEKNTNEKCKKISQILAISNKITPLMQSSTLKQIYNTLIQPHLSYGLLAWYNNIHGNVANNAALFKLQKKAVHMMHKSKFVAHTDPILKMYGILKLEDLFVIQGVQQYDRIKQKQCPHYLLSPVTRNNEIHSYVTRQINNIHLGEIRRQIKKYGLSYKLHSLMLHISNVLHLPIATRHNIKQFIISTYSEVCLIRNGYSCLFNCEHS